MMIDLCGVGSNACYKVLSFSWSCHCVVCTLELLRRGISVPISRALRVSGRAEETWSQSAMYSYNTFPIVAASAKGQRRLGPTVRKAVLGLFGFQTSLPDDPSILSISLTGLTRQPVLTAYTTSAPTTTTILILREEIPSSGEENPPGDLPFLNPPTLHGLLLPGPPSNLPPPRAAAPLRPLAVRLRLAFLPHRLLQRLRLHLRRPGAGGPGHGAHLPRGGHRRRLGEVRLGSGRRGQGLAARRRRRPRRLRAAVRVPGAGGRVGGAGAVLRRGRGVDTPLRAGRRGGGWAGRGRRRPRRRRVRV
jgi:hypothetical protein